MVLIAAAPGQVLRGLQAVLRGAEVANGHLRLGLCPQGPQGLILCLPSLRQPLPGLRILRVGIPAGIENGMFQIGKLSVASLTSTLGTAAIAANAVANTTSTFLNIPASAVGMAVLTVVGQCLGAGEKEQAVWYARRLLLLAYAGAWIMNLSAFFFADKLALTLFHLSPEAQAMALDIMVWFNIVSLFVWPSSFTLPNTCAPPVTPGLP